MQCPKVQESATEERIERINESTRIRSDAEGSVGGVGTEFP